MTALTSLDAQVRASQADCHHWLLRALFFSTVSLLLASSLWIYKDAHISFGQQTLEWSHIALAALIPGSLVCAIAWWAYAKLNEKLFEFKQASADLEWALRVQDRTLVQQTIDAGQILARKNPLIQSVISKHQTALDNHLSKLSKAELFIQLEADFNAFKQQCDRQLEEMKSQLPLIKIQNHIRASLAVLATRRAEISRQWEETYEKFSWWNKLKYGGTTPDFSKMDKVKHQLKSIDAALMRKHSADIQRIDSHLASLKDRAFARISAAKSSAKQFVAEYASQKDVDTDLLKKALWFSALSLPISAWTDLNRAGDVYDALRQVNGNFSGMSDADIWWETLFMSPESLAGLAALTKGAYFEQLVAADTGGNLHEYFNHPNTDIVIDGVAFQLKATDSASYVHSVSDEIPVIASSEVAMQTGAIDAGYSNEELTNTVDLALGGTLVDMGDSAVDAILSGLGGLGVLATLEGINHAVNKHKNGGDAVEAMFDGAGIAIEGTARALVGTAEMGFKVITSRPVRFVGRILLKGAMKLDEKMMAETDKKRR
jgi:hypothetical protein